MRIVTYLDLQAMLLQYSFIAAYKSSSQKNLLPRKLVYVNQLYQHALDRRLKALPKRFVPLLFMEMNIFVSNPFSIVKT